MRERANPVFLISLGITFLIVIWGLLSPTGLGAVTNKLFPFLITNFGWFYLMAMAFFLVFTIWIAFSKFGRVRLGPPDSRPDFSTVSWFAMLFSAGMGIGLVFWGVAEPLYHFLQPPSAQPGSTAAALFAIKQSFFHWGLHPWANYSIIALALAYFQFRKNAPGLISSIFLPLLGEKGVKGPIGQLIDILAIFATVAGVATSLGLGTLQINSGLNYLFGMPIGFFSQVLIIVVVSVLFMISAVTGLEKGIKFLSNLNLSLATLLMLLVILIGPTVAIINGFTNGIGDYLSNIIDDSLNINPFGDNSWLGSWTLFYWAWWIAWAPFVGTFIARISRGRTIREFVIGVLLVPALGSFLWFAAFGAAGIGAAIENPDVASTAISNVATALFEVFRFYPLGTLVSMVAIILVSVFFITSADSATFVLGMLSSDGNLNPSTQRKILWGVVQVLLAVVLLLSGGLQTLQIASLVAAFPFAIIMIFGAISLYKALTLEQSDNAR